MLQKIRNRKAQSTLEYAILVVIVIAALLTLQTYIKRGIGGRLKQASDDIGDQFSTGEGTSWNKTVVSKSVTKDTFVNGLSTTTIEGVAGGTMSTNTTENMVLANSAVEYWGKNAE